MYEDYWDLFWTTGLPQAWLMSREREGHMDAAPGLEDAPRRRLAPLSGGWPPAAGGMPGDPRGIV